MSNSSIDSVKNFSDSVKNITYIIILGFILIIVTYGTKISNSNFFSLILKIGIVGLYLYVFTTVYKSLSIIFNKNGLFIDPSMSKVKMFFILYCIFELAIIFLVFYILYTIFK
jgi:hypothetical protein